MCFNFKSSIENLPESVRVSLGNLLMVARFRWQDRLFENSGGGMLAAWCRLMAGHFGRIQLEMIQRISNFGDFPLPKIIFCSTFNESLSLKPLHRQPFLNDVNDLQAI